MSELVVLDEESFEDVGLDGGDVRDVLDDAVAEWNGIADVTLGIDATATTGAKVARNDTSVVFLTDGANPDKDGSVSQTVCEQSDPHETKECDTEVFTEMTGASITTWDWVLTDSASDGEFSLMNTMMHEMGHNLGLGDQKDKDTAETVMGYATVDSSGSPGVAYLGIIDVDEDALVWVYGP